MTKDTAEIRRIDWSEVLPWLIIFRSFAHAISLPMLTLALVGTLIMPLGWYVAGSVLPSQTGTEPALAGRAAIDAEIASWKAWPWQRTVRPPRRTSASAAVTPQRPSWVEPMWQVVDGAVRPFVALFQRPIDWRVCLSWLIGGLWSLLVWAILGGAMSRMSVVRLGRNDREGMFEALGFATKRFWAYFGAPLFPLLGVAVVVIMCLPVGWLMRWDIGAVVAAMLWFFVLLGGLMAAILLIGLLFGWPLMWGVTSSEEMGDVFEATQRTYSYTFGRPLHYLFYACVALLLGAAGFILVRAFAESVISLSHWAVEWSAGVDRMRAVATADHGPLFVARSIIAGLNGLVLAIASAYRYSFFWSATAAIYLLLRRNVDRTELDDIHDLNAQTRYGLPDLQQDEHGVPVVDDGDAE